MGLSFFFIVVRRSMAMAMVPTIASVACIFLLDRWLVAEFRKD
jgi:hypothetical protein